ncbi:hypothetical protein PACTADRAFT_45968 [Pachysolen tannophilus NRRL Y-2460]|uniref:Protein PBDC1 homolog n=1 Tax=Pachysolen tannophilus NRRL Y-2460 TaxID=669874 RepID=A0A1E4TPD2_PACTA|nr:hypothetical protein PACTADRAFT_45968 [Pachysolen tannophilus NRRL Y-2460]
MSLSTFNAETAENSEDIEKQFAVVAVEQAETYWKLISKIPGSRLKLTSYDDEIFDELIKHFPEFEDPNYVKVINENDLKNNVAKNKWRNYLKLFEKKIEDYNFGTLMRISSDGEYDQEGTIFVLRLQFYAIEICRNRYGLNDWIVKKN